MSNIELHQGAHCHQRAGWPGRTAFADADGLELGDLVKT